MPKFAPWGGNPIPDLEFNLSRRAMSVLNTGALFPFE